MGFKFKLHALKRVRQMEEEEAKMRLATILKREAELSLEIARTEQQKILWQEAYNTGGLKENSEKNQILIDHYLAKLAQHEKHLNDLKKALKPEIDKAKQELEWHHKRLKQVQKVEEKHKAIYLEEERRKTERQINEMTSLRHKRFQIEGLHDF